MKRLASTLILGLLSVATIHATPTLISQTLTLQPNKPALIAIHIPLETGWHTYGQHPGEMGIPPQFQWTLPANTKIEGPFYKPTHTFKALGVTQEGYEGEAIFLFKITPPKAPNIRLRVALSWLVCKDVCKPQKAVLTLTLPIQDIPPIINPKTKDIFKTQMPKPWIPTSTGMTILLTLASAFLGGLILNLMPCVFPILSLKILSLSKHHLSQKHKAIESLYYTAGILVSFWLLAILLLTLKSIGQQVGWGFQLQSPGMVLGLASLFLLLALNLFGVFEIGLTLTQLHTKNHHGNWGAFSTGILSTLVATPCAAPFVGSAIGIALVQPSWMTGIIFTSLALGLATPYVLISTLPGTQQLLPKPGPWLKTFKEFLGFPMLATCIWLLSILAKLSNPILLPALATLLGISLLAWTYGKWGYQHPYKSLFIVIALGLVIWGLNQSPTKTTEHIDWKPFSAQAIEDARKSGPVFIDFGADWCLTCQFNEKTTLQNPKIVQAFRTHHIQAFKADWTHQDPQITQALAKFNRNSIPCYIYYPQGKEAEILPELLRVEDLESTLK